MANKLEAHTLHSYSASCLNRDDQNQVKTVVFGGETRLRTASQSLKREIRTSNAFQDALLGKLSVRTKEIGPTMHAIMVENGMDSEKALKPATEIALIYGSLEDAKVAKPGKAVKPAKDVAGLRSVTIAHVSPDEMKALKALAVRVATEDVDLSTELNLLSKPVSAVDTAMFGRMLANSPEFKMDGSVSVSHGLTTHAVMVEKDFFTAVDDLSKNSGSAHLDFHSYGAGVFYTHFCVDLDLLLSNLGGDQDLADRAVRALLTAIATVSPSGKQNTFLSATPANYMRVTKSSGPPRSLSSAFLKSISGPDLLHSSIQSLERVDDMFNHMYGGGKTMAISMLDDNTKTLDDILNFATEV